MRVAEETDAKDYSRGCRAGAHTVRDGGSPALHRRRLWPYRIEVKPCSLVEAHYHPIAEELVTVSGELTFSDLTSIAADLIAVTTGDGLILPKVLLTESRQARAAPSTSWGCRGRFPLTSFGSSSPEMRLLRWKPS